MNEGVYNGDDEVYSGPYYYTVDASNNPIRTEYSSFQPVINADNHNWGMITYDKGFILSSNVVAAEIQNRLITPDTDLSYLKKFGFFQPVSSDGMAEETGILMFTWPYEKLALAYGQGSTVTTLQMLQGYSAIFGDGTMKRPYYIESIRDPYDSNHVIYQAQTKITGTPITEETAKRMQELMAKVVTDENGTARHYKIPECGLLAKTGTAQVAINGSYQSGITIASIMAALPADDPKVMVYYASEAPYNITAHRYTEATVHVLRTVAMKLGLSESSDSSDESSTETAETVTAIRSEMPQLINHSLSYAEEKLADSQADVLVLGAGDTVINQYPTEGSTVYSGQHVFLVTDTNSFVMPDLTGWSRRDVTALWQVVQFGFKLSGEGTVISQNIEPGTTVTKGTEIEVEFG